jgi:serine/threonine-protein kinase
VGEGGFERLVAVKVMHEHIAAEQEFRSMFLDEARLAARIRHPNVVAVIDVQKAPEGLFLVMDYVDGPSLHQLRRKLSERHDKLPLAITLRIFVDVLTGLHAAHELSGSDGAPLNLVHRDVSPQNILVGRDGVSRITDFGVARAEARITSTRGGQLKGKIAYMPPEQLANEGVDRRADIYAAAVAFWEALTGRRLFEAESEAALVHLIIGGSKRSPSAIDPSIPEPISAACMAALRLRPAERPASAADFADAIEDAARVAGIAIASTRQVAAYLAGLPRTVSERPPLGAQPPSGSGARPVPSASAADVPLGAGAAPMGSAPAIQPESTTTRGLVTVAEKPPARPGRRLAYVAGIGGVAVVAVGAWLAFERAGSSDTRSSASQPVASHVGSASSSVRAEPKAVATVTAEVASGALGAAPSAAPSAAAVPVVSAPAKSAEVPSQAPPRGGRPAKPPAKPPRGPSGPGYDPGEL